MEVSHLSLHTKRYRDVFTYLQNCMSTKGFHGDPDMLRFQIFFFLSLIVESHSSVQSNICMFMWQRYVSDFYISDFQSGLRALVKAGYGSKVSPFVVPETVANVTSQTKDLSPSFLQWLADRSLSNDSRAMRLKEGYAFFYLHIASLITFLATQMSLGSVILTYL